MRVEEKKLIEANTRLVDEIRGLNYDIAMLESRIDKAIEYINNHKEKLNHSFDEPDCDYWIATNPDDLLNILKGDYYE